MAARCLPNLHSNGPLYYRLLGVASVLQNRSRNWPQLNFEPPDFLDSLDGLYTLILQTYFWEMCPVIVVGDFPRREPRVASTSVTTRHSLNSNSDQNEVV